MFDWFKKWRAIRSYRKALGPELRKRYGQHKSYSPKRIEFTARKLGLDDDFLVYADLMYASKNQFEAHFREVGDELDYESLRSEIKLPGGDDAIFGDGEPSLPTASEHEIQNSDVVDAAGLD